MNRLIATLAGHQIGTCLIHTGAHKSARRVPAAFARMVLNAGPDLTLTLITARGPQPRQIIQRAGRFYTRVVRAGGAA